MQAIQGGKQATEAAESFRIEPTLENWRVLPFFLAST
jgi:hypothetical protein